MTTHSAHTVSRRFEWDRERDSGRSGGVEDLPVEMPRMPAVTPQTRRSSVGRRQALKHLSEFDHTPGPISYDVDDSLRGTRFRDYFAGNLTTVGRRKFERKVRRNKANLVLVTLGVVLFWAVARFFWPV